MPQLLPMPSICIIRKLLWIWRSPILTSKGSLLPMVQLTTTQIRISVHGRLQTLLIWSQMISTSNMRKLDVGCILTTWKSTILNHALKCLNGSNREWLNSAFTISETHLFWKLTSSKVIIIFNSYLSSSPLTWRILISKNALLRVKKWPKLRWISLSTLALLKSGKLFILMKKSKMSKLLHGMFCTTILQYMNHQTGSMIFSLNTAIECFMLLQM